MCSRTTSCAAPRSNGSTAWRSVSATSRFGRRARSIRTKPDSGLKERLLRTHFATCTAWPDASLQRVVATQCQDGSDERDEGQSDEYEHGAPPRIRVVVEVRVAAGLELRGIAEVEGVQPF